MAKKSKKLWRTKLKDLNGYILISFCVLYFLTGYVGHNTLVKIVEQRGVSRVNDCHSSGTDIVICMNYFPPRGWEKLVRF